jgi:hypothetical protein
MRIALARSYDLTRIEPTVHGELRASIASMPLEETLQRLPPAAVEFARELCDHHWSEAAWLYTRREVLHVQGNLLSPEQWLEIEARAEAHVVALCRGGRLVLDEIEARIGEGDAGELHTAVRVLCRGDHVEQLDASIDALDWPVPARAAAVVDALVWDAPEQWQQLVAAILTDEAAPEDAVGPLATVAGLRGWPLGSSLVGVLEDRVGDLAATADAVARLRVAEAKPVLSELISSAGATGEVRCAAMVAAACFDARAVAAYAWQLVGSEPWAAVPLAMTAGGEALPVLTAALERWPGQAEILLGLGLLGHVDGIPRLLEALADEEAAPAAAEALYLITGAALHEEVSLVEVGDEGDEGDEGDDAEGAGDDGEEGEEAGLPVSRLTCSRERWVAWLETHRLASRFGSMQRVRLGEPFAPLRVLDELERTTLRPELREVMATELWIRYRLPRWYSSRLLFFRQRHVLAQIRAALAKYPRMEAGAWVVEGRVLPSHASSHIARAR